MRARLALLVSTSLALVGASASAQTSQEDPREAAGQSLRAQGRDAEALEVFREVYARTRAPRALARIALAEAALGRWIDAEAHLVDALSSSDAWIAANRREPAGGLEGALALMRSHLGNLVVRSRTPGATLWIAGVERAELPLTRPLRVSEGTLSVELRAPGHLSTVRSAVIRGGVEAPVSIDLDLDAQPTSQAPPTHPHVPPVVVPDPPPLRPLGIAALGVGVAGLALGVGAYLAGRSDASEFADSNCYATGGSYAWDPSWSGHGSQSACQSLGGSVETWRAVEVAGFVAAGVFAAAGITLLAWPQPRAPHTLATFSCGPSGRSFGLACGGSF